MNKREQAQNDLLAQCIHHDASGELYRGEERILHTEREERCLRRAMWLMAFCTGLGALGLGYSVILLYEVAPYYTRIINHILTVFGLASLISLLAFWGAWLRCRHRLTIHREEVRRLILKLLADRGPVPRPAKGG